jgi:hypothetical protein
MMKDGRSNKMREDTEETRDHDLAHGAGIPRMGPYIAADVPEMGVQGQIHARKEGDETGAHVLAITIACA